VLTVALLVAAGCGQSSEDKAKKQVCNARSDLKTQVSSIVQSVASASSVSDAKSQLKSATQQLADSYQQSLAKVDCS
jgi:Tfp pilus assembly protein PilP